MGSNVPPPSRLIAATRLGHVALLNAQVGVMGGWRCERGEKCGQQNSRLLADTRLLALLSAQVGGEGGGVRLCAQGIRRGVLGGAHACVAGRPFLPPIAHCEPAHTALPPPTLPQGELALLGVARGIPEQAASGGVWDWDLAAAAQAALSAQQQEQMVATVMDEPPPPAVVAGE